MEKYTVNSCCFYPRRQSHASNNTSLFLASLSLADLLFLLLYVPLDLWRQLDSSVYQVLLILASDWSVPLRYVLWLVANHQTAPVCKIISYIEMLTALASVINLSAVSMERWVGYWPLIGQEISRNVTLILASDWPLPLRAQFKFEHYISKF